MSVAQVDFSVGIGLLAPGGVAVRLSQGATMRFAESLGLTADDLWPAVFHFSNHEPSLDNQIQKPARPLQF